MINPFKAYYEVLMVPCVECTSKLYYDIFTGFLICPNCGRKFNVFLEEEDVPREEIN